MLSLRIRFSSCLSLSSLPFLNCTEIPLIVIVTFVFIIISYKKTVFMIFNLNLLFDFLSISTHGMILIYLCRCINQIFNELFENWILLFCKEKKRKWFCVCIYEYENMEVCHNYFYMFKFWREGFERQNLLFFLDRLWIWTHIVTVIIINYHFPSCKLSSEVYLLRR